MRENEKENEKNKIFFIVCLKEIMKIDIYIYIYNHIYINIDDNKR